jgi:5S rRNA maturation endonuclease (ribonuclease M5)
LDRQEIEMTTEVDSVATAIDMAKNNRTATTTKCPAHDDHMASLSVGPGEDQPVTMYCHAGCTFEQILAAADLGYDAVMAERVDETATGNDNVWTPAGPASHRYIYTDENGKPLFEVLRVPKPGGKKTFRQRHPDPTESHGWAWNMDGVERVLYRLPEVLRAKAEGRTIFIVEGEKDVETLRRQRDASGEQVVATTSPMGAGKWRPEYSQTLAGASVIIIVDADATGRAHGRTVREELMKHGCSVAIKEPKLGCKDVTDHINAGGTFDDLLETKPEDAEEKQSYGLDILEVVKRVFNPATFIVPGMLAEGDRFLLTGFEGHGKSTLMRMMGIMIAAGIHPWTLQDMPPQKVLFADGENHPDQVLESWQELVTLAEFHGHPIQPGMLTVLEEWDSEIDLTSEDGRQWMIERVHAYHPRVFLLGPLYNMSNRDLKDDETVRKIKSAIAEARAICGTAFILEHHAPHKGPGDKERSVRPYGSSTFLKFPEFGFGLKPYSQEKEHEGWYEFQRTRMPRVRSRYFPPYLRWGTPGSAEWPWVAEELGPEEQAA